MLLSVQKHRRFLLTLGRCGISALYIFIPTTASGPPPLESFKGRLRGFLPNFLASLVGEVASAVCAEDGGVKVR